MPANETAGNVKPSKHKTKAKKAAGDKEAKASVQCVENKASDISNSAGTQQKAASLEWFTSEIQSMMKKGVKTSHLFGMENSRLLDSYNASTVEALYESNKRLFSMPNRYGFGDCKTPLLESAQLIEEIVHQQMKSMLVQAADIASLRNARFIGLEDIVFLMRKDKAKLSRLITYLGIKDTKAAVIRSIGLDDDDIADSAGDVKAQPRLKRIKLCQDFLTSIDQTGELSLLFDEDIVDEVKVEREMRADQHSASMDQAQYLEYCEARRSSFGKKYRSNKFRDWLLKNNLTDIKPNAIALELFNYLAYETVAQIVDLALLVKQDSQGQPNDPFSRLAPPTVYNPDYPSFQSFSRQPVYRPDSPTQSVTSPPSSPSQEKNTSHSSTSPSNSVSKPKPKKRRKSEGKLSLELFGSRCIQPSEIREAIRRYWRPNGTMMLFSKLHHSHLRTRLLCC